MLLIILNVQIFYTYVKKLAKCIISLKNVLTLFQFKTLLDNWNTYPEYVINIKYYVKEVQGIRTLVENQSNIDH